MDIGQLPADKRPMLRTSRETHRDPSLSEKVRTWDRTSRPPINQEWSNSGGARPSQGGSRSKAEARGGKSDSHGGMWSVDGCVMAPLVHHEGPYSLERPWSVTTSHQDSTLLRINWLQFSMTSTPWTRQPRSFDSLSLWL